MTKSAKKINVKERVDDDTIDLSLSEIVEVPVKDIALYKRAINLDLSCNKIVSLTDNFGILAHLVKLDLSKNQIRELPASFGKLASLKHLDLYRNQIEHLPLEMGQLRNLRYLDLKSNPLKSGVEKIVGQCLTVKECQLAAKRIVPFLADMQVQIREDRERLKKAKEERDAELERRRLEQEEQLANGDGEAAAEPSESPAPAGKRPKPKRERKRKDTAGENGDELAGNGPLAGTRDRQPDSRRCGCRRFFGQLLFALLVLAVAVALAVRLPLPEAANGSAVIVPYSAEHFRYVVRTLRHDYAEPVGAKLLACAKQTIDVLHEVLAAWTPA